MNLGYLPWLPPMMVGVLGPVVLVAEIACVIHAIRHGRPYWWIWLLVGFPVVGVAAYVALEVRPSFRGPDVQDLLWRFKGPEERLRILEAELEESSTVHNRLRLARELVGQRRYDRATEVLDGGLRGPNKAHAELLLRLADAHLLAGRVDAAADTLARAPTGGSADAQLRRGILEGRLLDAQDRPEEAEARLRDTVARSRAELARYELAAFLVRRGRAREGFPLLDEILMRYRKGTRVWRFQEREAFEAAKRLRKTPPPPEAGARAA